VPLQRLPVRLADGVTRHPDALTVEGHVGLAVVEVVLEAAADEEATVGGDGDVAGVEETVDVGAEEEAVVEAVLAPSATGRMCAASRTGRAFSPVTAQRRR